MKGRTIELKVSPDAAKLLDKIKEQEGMSEDEEVFRRAFTLYRIILDTYKEGGEVFRKIPHQDQERIALRPY
ncbi:hypothetical protein HOE04_01820 [archaeon]|jgi:hypothetical protein|nr:hypothetical protein [archaeon]